jgi:glycosyltransferase involved in cell wall biosynthesis
MSGVIVHEWIEKIGGSEAVLSAMRQAFPGSDVVCLWNERTDKSDDVQESWLARSPLRGRKALALPIMPMVWTGITENKGYDWALISSHAFAHHFSFKKRTPNEDVPKKIYVHTPARYIWEPNLDPRGQGALARAFAPAMRKIDRRRAQEQSEIVANSEFVRTRIARCWDRDAGVIYPPVDTRYLQSVTDWRTRLQADELTVLSGLPSTFLLGASRLVGYKRLDLAIDIANANDCPLVIAGTGPEERNLRTLAENARVPVHFIPRPSSEMLYALYQQAMALVFMAVEDFGIMPVEAMAIGTPAIVNNIGGASESVIHNRTGYHVQESTRSEYRSAFDSVQKVAAQDCRRRAMKFDSSQFEKQLRDWVLSGAVRPPNQKDAAWQES